MRALSVLGLLLAASLVSGGEEPARQPVPPEEDLDLAKLERPKRTEPPVDVFALKTIVPPVPLPVPVVVAEPAPPAPPPAPPALPFRYVGKFVEGGSARLLVAKGDADYSIQGGETLEGLYRVEQITEEAIVFTYLPLNAQQTLSLVAAGDTDK